MAASSFVRAIRPARRARSRRRTVSVLMLLVLLMSAVGVLTAPAALADQTIISASGPLTSIRTSNELHCEVHHIDNPHSYGEFYGNDSCGTFVALNGTLYGWLETPFTFVSQSTVLGTGNCSPSCDPFRIVTEVALGSTGVRLIQTDSYLPGEPQYRTDMQLINNSGSPISPIVYRAADCYLRGNDSGFGMTFPDGGVACARIDDSGSRVERWAPLPSSDPNVAVRFYQAGYNEVYNAVSSQQPFPNTCR